MTGYFNTLDSVINLLLSLRPTNLLLPPPLLPFPPSSFMSVCGVFLDGVVFLGCVKSLLHINKSLFLYTKLSVLCSSRDVR